jgi:hypothetical protein
MGWSEDVEPGNVYPLEDYDLDESVRWIRFDYNSTGANSVLHMNCHLHISGLPGTRFAVAGIPTPKQFVEFVVGHFYPNDYQSVRLDGNQQFGDVDVIDSINAQIFDRGAEPLDTYRRISHFRTPGF